MTTKPTTTVNLSDFGFDDENDFAVNTEIVPLQWLNPQVGVSGLAITPENAVKALFDPKSAGWELLEADFPSSGRKKLWMTKSPRIVILNGSSTIGNGIEGNPNPRFMDHYEPVLDQSGKPVLDDEGSPKKQWKGVIPFDNTKYGDPNYTGFGKLVIVIIGKNNEVLSSPLILKTGTAATMTFVNLYKNEFIPKVIDLYTQAGGKVPSGQKPTCKFLSRFVFEPLLTEGMVGTKKKSSGTRADSFKSLSLERFSEIVISAKTTPETTEAIASYVENVLDYVKYVPLVANAESTEDAIASAPVDPETGEIAVTPEVLAELTKGDIPF